MKRLLCLLILVLLLTGCGEKPAQIATEPTLPTEPTASWVELQGRPWDREGALVELPMDIPNGLIYTSHMFFDGDLLLWSQDEHKKDHPCVNICIFDLDTGTVRIQEELELGFTMIPQALGDALYIIDSRAGSVTKLDRNLNQVQKWYADFGDSSVFMAENEIAYVDPWDDEAYKLDLKTGEKSAILEEGTQISYFSTSGGYLEVVYYHPDSGEECVSFIDLKTGERYDAPFRGNTNCEFRGGNFLLNEFTENYAFTLIPVDADAVTVELGYDHIKLIEDGLLLMTGENGNVISLHDLSGKALAQCRICDDGYYYEYLEIIPNESLGGYFLILGNESRAVRLLYWDTNVGEKGSDIPFVPVPEPSQQEALIQTRVTQLEERFGVDILVGEEAQDYFYDFTAETVTDYNDILDALDTLENALEDYPEGFFRQLRYGDIYRTQIHLMGTITATNSEYVDTYEAFVQDGYDAHVMVMDIYLSDEGTYYHEFSHVIDSFLEWDAANREEALFSEDAWNAMNPDWFDGYTWNYSWQQELEDYSAFVDEYSTIKPTEDRARVLEYAMAEYGYWTFRDCPVLTNKLDYYCRCIRDAFDTSGWPEVLLWEQYLTE